MSGAEDGKTVGLAGRDLARIGAESAETAFSLLADRSVLMGEIIVGLATDEGVARPAVSSQWECGVFFELEGCAESVVGLLFQAAQRDALIEQMMGEPAKTLSEIAAESVLTEVANIVASHVASGIADASGGRLLPSLPTLVVSDAASQLEVFLREHASSEAPRHSCELADGGAGIGALLVFVPTADS
ncbi:MAG: hypothetical protein VX246_08585 [Myxococcota bacterium]|nr:hypothetical protein [Myxococcota bacterium]